MTEFIRERVVRHETRHWRVFHLPDTETSRYRFPCDADGHVDPDGLTAPARTALPACLSGRLDVVDKGVEVDEHTWVEPALIRCRCARAEVELSGFTNTCPACGRDYNASGSLLAPREQWGEETGESLADILRIR